MKRGWKRWGVIVFFAMMNDPLPPTTTTRGAHAAHAAQATHAAHADGRADGRSYDYDDTSDYFDALEFWDAYGTRTIERLLPQLPPGPRVLDVCSGTGSSALAAAHAIKPSRGEVVAVDISRPLLDRARAKADRQGLTNISFRVADMASLDPADDDGRLFDAVVVVFGIFFAPDIAAQIRALKKMLRPGGVMALTIWGPRLFEPLYSVMLESVRRRRRLRRPREEYRPWDRVTSSAEFAKVLSEAGLSGSFQEESGRCELESPDAFWNVVLGTGLRWFIDELTDEEAAEVRAECMQYARDNDVRSIETNVIYGLARI